MKSYCNACLWTSDSFKLLEKNIRFIITEADVQGKLLCGGH